MLLLMSTSFLTAAYSSSQAKMGGAVYVQIKRANSGVGLYQSKGELPIKRGGKCLQFYVHALYPSRCWKEPLGGSKRQVHVGQMVGAEVLLPKEKCNTSRN